MNENLRAQSLRMAVDILGTKGANTEDLFNLSDRLLSYIKKNPLDDIKPVVTKKDLYSMNYTPEDLLKLKVYTQDPIAFIEECVHIPHPIKGKVPFKLYDFQKEIINAYSADRFVIGNIARQMGSTSVTAAFFLWWASVKPNQNILILSNKMAQSMEIMDRIRFAYENIPQKFKPAVSVYSKQHMQFENGSQFIARAATQDSGRGLSVDYVWIDGAAYISHKPGRELWMALQPILSTGGRCILTSTPYDTDGFFYDIWHNEKNGFKKVLMPYTRHPERDEEWAKEFRIRLGEEFFQREFECKFVPRQPK